MRGGKLILRAIAVLALAGTSASAVAEDDFAWRVVSPANNHFSMETPCSADEIAKLASVPDSALGGFTFKPDSRVACNRLNTMFLAGEVSSDSFPAASATLFDSLIEHAKDDATVEGTPRMATVSGHRAWFNRQDTGGLLAQTGIIEIDRSTVLFVIAGAQRDSGMTIRQQRDMVDHFYRSIKVTAP